MFSSRSIVKAATVAAVLFQIYFWAAVWCLHEVPAFPGPFFQEISLEEGAWMLERYQQLELGPFQRFLVSILDLAEMFGQCGAAVGLIAVLGDRDLRRRIGKGPLAGGIGAGVLVVAACFWYGRDLVSYYRLPLVLVPAAVLSGLLILLSVRALGRGT